MRRRLLLPMLVVVALLALPATANAHPLGNFTINRYSGLDLRPGRTYQVRVGYMTRNEAHGVCVVQAREGFKAQASMKLTDSGGGWKTATASFVRQDGVPVRLVIDNTSVGEGNTLFIRSVELVELAAPGN